MTLKQGPAPQRRLPLRIRNLGPATNSALNSSRGFAKTSGGVFAEKEDFICSSYNCRHLALPTQTGSSSSNARRIRIVNLPSTRLSKHAPRVGRISHRSPIMLTRTTPNDQTEPTPSISIRTTRYNRSPSCSYSVGVASARA